MTRFKRTISMMLAFMLLVLPLSSCGSAKQAESEEPPPEPEVIKADPASYLTELKSIIASGKKVEILKGQGDIGKQDTVTWEPLGTKLTDKYPAEQSEVYEQRNKIARIMFGVEADEHNAGTLLVAPSGSTTDNVCYLWNMKNGANDNFVLKDKPRRSLAWSFKYDDIFHKQYKYTDLNAGHGPEAAKEGVENLNSLYELFPSTVASTEVVSREQFMVALLKAISPVQELDDSKSKEYEAKVGIKTPYTKYLYLIDNGKTFYLSAADGSLNASNLRKPITQAEVVYALINVVDQYNNINRSESAYNNYDRTDNPTLEEMLAYRNYESTKQYDNVIDGGNMGESLGLSELTDSYRMYLLNYMVEYPELGIDRPLYEAIKKSRALGITASFPEGSLYNYAERGAYIVRPAYKSDNETAKVYKLETLKEEHDRLYPNQYNPDWEPNYVLDLGEEKSSSEQIKEAFEKDTKRIKDFFEDNTEKLKNFYEDSTEKLKSLFGKEEEPVVVAEKPAENFEVFSMVTRDSALDMIMSTFEEMRASGVWVWQNYEAMDLMTKEKLKAEQEAYKMALLEKERAARYANAPYSYFTDGGYVYSGRIETENGFEWVWFKSQEEADAATAATQEKADRNLKTSEKELEDARKEREEALAELAEADKAQQEQQTVKENVESGKTMGTWSADPDDPVTGHTDPTLGNVTDEPWDIPDGTPIVGFH